MKIYLLFHNITSRVTSDPSVKFCELLRAWGRLFVPIRKPWIRKKIREWVEI